MRSSFADRVKCSHADKFIRAMRAINAGNATEAQQKLAFAWIVNVACRVDEPTFWPGDPHASAYLEGRRSIAIDIVALIKAKPEKQKETDSE